MAAPADHLRGGLQYERLRLPRKHRPDDVLCVCRHLRLDVYRRRHRMVRGPDGPLLPARAARRARLRLAHLGDRSGDRPRRLPSSRRQGRPLLDGLRRVRPERCRRDRPLAHATWLQQAGNRRRSREHHGGRRLVLHNLRRLASHRRLLRRRERTMLQEADMRHHGELIFMQSALSFAFLGPLTSHQRL